jgi:intracellular sulfur oxidation DsrE/DsrF family protein
MRAGAFAQVVLACLCLAGVCDAEIGAATTGARYFAEVSVDDPGALADLLNRAEGLVNTTPRPEPIVILLHGPEAEPFLRKNYTANRDVVNLAARLDAFKVVDVKVCETWMRDNQVDAEDMPAFIETVPYAPAAVEQLEEAGYVRF